MPEIHRGMVGPKVTDLQIALQSFIDANLKTDGIFGPKTEQAVRIFQMVFSLPSDGIVGKRTGACLVAASFGGAYAMNRIRAIATVKALTETN